MESITLVIGDDSASLDPRDIAEFLYLFQAAYVGLRRVLPKSVITKAERPSRGTLDLVRERLLNLSPRELSGLFAAKGEVARITQIRRESPMEIALVGCMVVLTFAVVLSGGSITLSPEKVAAKLPSLGTGLKSLLDALGLNRNESKKVGFGLRPPVIKLNLTEFRELMRPDAGTKGQGGFQSFFLSLQYRVNKATRTLELTEADVERIHRALENPSAGGWQGRLTKIFGRHFKQHLPPAIDISSKIVKVFEVAPGRKALPPSER